MSLNRDNDFLSDLYLFYKRQCFCDICAFNKQCTFWNSKDFSHLWRNFSSLSCLASLPYYLIINPSQKKILSYKTELKLLNLNLYIYSKLPIELESASKI